MSAPGTLISLMAAAAFPKQLNAIPAQSKANQAVFMSSHP
jgi:hypothetical protein